jgi:hypothetical protein
MDSIGSVLMMEIVRVYQPCPDAVRRALLIVLGAAEPAPAGAPR